jgi:hypothetical protein
MNHRHELLPDISQPGGTNRGGGDYGGRPGLADRGVRCHLITYRFPPRIGGERDAGLSVACLLSLRAPARRPELS